MDVQGSKGTDSSVPSLDMTDLMDFAASTESKQDSGAASNSVRPDPDSSNTASPTSDSSFERTASPVGGANGPWPSALTLISIPAGSTLRIDGVAQADLAKLAFQAGDPIGSLSIPLPPGTHAVGLHEAGSSQLQSSSGFLDYYTKQRARYRRDGELDLGKLIQAAVATRGFFPEPIVPHLFGNYYFEQGELEAAERFWNLAIQTNPTFAPAHLNLAYAAHQRGDSQVASHQWKLATAFNVQDAFGIGDHASSLAESLTLDGTQSPFDGQDYWSSRKLSARDLDVIHVLLAMRDQFRSSSERAACLNNIGVYLAQEVGQHDAAMFFFHQARRELAQYPDSAATQTNRKVMDNMVNAAQAGEFVETDVYRRLASSL